MQRVVGLLIPLITTAACTSDPSSSIVPSPSGSTTAVSQSPVSSEPPPTTSLDASGARPVLTLGRFAWSTPAIWQARDLHDVAIYGDGRMVRLAYVRDDAGGGSYVTTTIEVGAAELEEWVSLADEAGLDDPGYDDPALLPDGIQIADGGYTVVSRRTAGGIGITAIDQPSLDDATGQSERRLALDQLVGDIAAQALLDLSGEPVTSWAIESAVPLASIDAARWPWSDLDPATLEWSRNNAGVWCAIVEGRDWPFTEEEAFDYETVQSGIFRRPLLPHESTCDDVFAWRADLGYAERVDAWPDGLNPN